MAGKHLVIDGSNIATEGHSVPSLAQLESAVEEIRKDLPDTQVTVVVDATFAHRIDPSELSRFEAAALRGEYVYPPAGAIGRGDAFLLRIAEKVNATVLSNDSFQEFHGEHPWLFEPGRLLGATPVPGIGWIFVPRTPVRGPRSRVAVREATRAKSQVERAIADATAEATEPDAPAAPRSRSRRKPARANEPTPERAPVEARRPEAVNEPMAFISFIAEHPLGAVVDGAVDSFTSHGAVIMVGDVRCYVPLAGLADPAPRSAREVLGKGETRSFVITALDPYRRGIELALPSVGVVRGVPTEETVAAELEMTRPSRRKRSTAADPAVPVPETPAEGSSPARSRRRSPAKPAAKPVAESVAEADASPSGTEPPEALPVASGPPAPRRRRASKAAEPVEEPVREVPHPDEPDPPQPKGRARRSSGGRAAGRPASPGPAEATPTPAASSRTRAAKRTAPVPVVAPEGSPAPTRGARRSKAAAAAEPAPTKRVAKRAAPKVAAEAPPAAASGPRKSPAKRAAPAASVETRS